MNDLNVQLRKGLDSDPDYRGCWVLSANHAGTLIELRVDVAGDKHEMRIFSVNRAQRDDIEVMPQHDIDLNVSYAHSCDEQFDEEAYRKKYYAVEWLERYGKHTLDVINELKLRWELLRRIINFHST